MDLDPGTRVYLKAGGHLDVRASPWQAAYMLWGRHDSGEQPGITNADAADMGYAALIGAGGQENNVKPSDVSGIAPIPAD